VSFADQQSPLAERSNLYASVPGPNTKGSPIYALAARMVAQPDATYSWLLTHVNALRAGDVTLDRLP
jgi:hypothetical protein